MVQDSAASTRRVRQRSPRRGGGRGAILLEVVIALGLFAMAAVFVLDGLNASVRGVRLAQLEATATDLSVTIDSYLRMGGLPLVTSGPEAFTEPIDDQWSWQVVVNDAPDQQLLPQLKQVEIIIRREVDGFTHRTNRLIWESPLALEGAGGLSVDDLGIGDVTGALPALPGLGGGP